MLCRMSCTEGVSRRTVVVPGMRWRKEVDLAAKRGLPNQVHGDEGEVVVRLVDNTLYDGTLEGSIDAVPDLHKWGGDR